MVNNYLIYCFSVGTYVGAAVGGIVFLIVVTVVVLCICAAKNSQRNRVVTMHGGGATVTNVNNVNTIQHPRMLSCISLKMKSLYIYSVDLCALILTHLYSLFCIIIIIYHYQITCNFTVAFLIFSAI